MATAGCGAATGAGVALGLGLSPLGARLAAGLPRWVLVGFRGDRVLVEPLLDRTYQEGLAPVEPSHHGRNVDVPSRVTALRAALPASGRVPRRLAAPVAGVWNALFHSEPANGGSTATSAAAAVRT